MGQQYLSKDELQLDRKYITLAHLRRVVSNFSDKAILTANDLHNFSVFNECGTMIGYIELLDGDGKYVPFFAKDKEIDNA